MYATNTPRASQRRFVFDKCWGWNGLQAFHRLHAFSLKGVAKRILHLRIKVPLNIRIGPRAVDEISTALKSLKACILCEKRFYVVCLFDGA